MGIKFGRLLTLIDDKSVKGLLDEIGGGKFKVQEQRALRKNAYSKLLENFLEYKKHFLFNDIATFIFPSLFDKIQKVKNET